MSDVNQATEGVHCKGATLRIHHKVRTEAQARYETWLRQIIEAAGRFPGHQGVHILRPPAGERDYEIAVRFASEEDAQRWRESNERRELMAVIQPELAQGEDLEVLSGIDYWFTSPEADAKVPVLENMGHSPWAGGGDYRCSGGLSGNATSGAPGLTLAPSSLTPGPCCE